LADRSDQRPTTVPGATRRVRARRDLLHSQHPHRLTFGCHRPAARTWRLARPPACGLPLLRTSTHVRSIRSIRRIPESHSALSPSSTGLRRVMFQPARWSTEFRVRGGPAGYAVPRGLRPAEWAPEHKQVPPERSSTSVPGPLPVLRVAEPEHAGVPRRLSAISTRFGRAPPSLCPWWQGPNRKPWRCLVHRIDQRRQCPAR